MIFLSLINNITLIISLSILYSFIIRRWKYGSGTGRVFSGVLFGAVAIIGMMNPLVFSPGLIFDGRSIIISVAGFLGGWVTALIAAVMAIVYRTSLGGPGAVMGFFVITSSAVIGVAYHYIRRYKPQAAGPLYLIGFGIVVHVFMLIMTMTLPAGMKYDVLSKIALPVMTIYPLGTFLVCIVLLDLESRLRAEDALRKSEERYRSLVENADEAIMVVQDEMIKFVNSRAVVSFGYEEDEFLSISVFELVHPEDRNIVMERYLEKIAGDSKPTRHTYRAIHKSGKTVWIEISSVLIDWDGRPATLNLITDITERRNTEEERQSLAGRLQRAEKMEALGQMAGGVAHDLNNVLGVLTGYSELLLMEIPEGERARKHVEKILQSTEKGSAIIQDLLTLARRSVTTAEVINLNNVVSGFLNSPVFEKIKDSHPLVIFRAECQDELLNVKCSPVHLEKTLMNLVTNAAESISGQGEVTIKTQNRYLDKAVSGYDEVKEGDYVVLTVSDTGMGIPAENREKIFEPFYTKKTMGRSGTSLGLAIVWGTVKDHDGYIDLQTNVGKGSSFTLYFPVTREELVAPLQKVPVEQYMGRGESVLVVDDIAEQRDVASGLLNQLGYRVDTVSSGEEAVTYLKSHKADILVLDMIMAPGIDGLETYKKILEINPKQKAVLVSGFSETSRVREAQRLGAGAYVKKPYIMEKIGLAIRDELKR